MTPLEASIKLRQLVARYQSDYKMTQPYFIKCVYEIVEDTNDAS